MTVPAAPVTAPASSITALSSPVAAPLALIIFQAASTPHNAITLPRSDIGYLFLAGSGTQGPLKFAMMSDCGASSDFVDSHSIGDTESQIRGIVKLDPPATIIVDGHNTRSGQHEYPCRSRHRRPRPPPRHVAAGHECVGAWPSPIFRREGGA